MPFLDFNLFAMIRKKGTEIWLLPIPMRSASFGIVTSLPDDIIDSFDISSTILKNVFELEIEFQLLVTRKITFHFQVSTSYSH